VGVEGEGEEVVEGVVAEAAAAFCLPLLISRPEIKQIEKLMSHCHFLFTILK
jgi:hypothetical protein